MKARRSDGNQAKLVKEMRAIGLRCNKNNMAVKRFVIKGSYNGLNYWLKIEEEKEELYSWRGLKESATLFFTEQDAHEILIIVSDTAKRKLSIEPLE